MQSTCGAKRRLGAAEGLYPRPVEAFTPRHQNVCAQRTHLNILSQSDKIFYTRGARISPRRRRDFTRRLAAVFHRRSPSLFRKQLQGSRGAFPEKFYLESAPCFCPETGSALRLAAPPAAVPLRSAAEFAAKAALAARRLSENISRKIEWWGLVPNAAVRGFPRTARLS